MSLREPITERGPIDAPGLTIAERVCRLRWKYADKPGRPLSHDRFAKLIGGTATRTTVIRWERGTVPVDYAERLGELAGVPAHVFLKETAPTDRQILLTINGKLDRILELLMGGAAGMAQDGLTAAAADEAAEAERHAREVDSPPPDQEEESSGPGTPG